MGEGLTKGIAPALAELGLNCPEPEASRILTFLRSHLLPANVHSTKEAVVRKQADGIVQDKSP